MAPFCPSINRPPSSTIILTPPFSPLKILPLRNLMNGWLSNGKNLPNKKTLALTIRLLQRYSAMHFPVLTHMAILSTHMTLSSHATLKLFPCIGLWPKNPPIPNPSLLAQNILTLRLFLPLILLTSTLLNLVLSHQIKSLKRLLFKHPRLIWFPLPLEAKLSLL